jgi:hypothetical protein
MRVQISDMDDIHKLVASEAGHQAIEDTVLGLDCVAHARMFFN